MKSSITVLALGWGINQKQTSGKQTTGELMDDELKKIVAEMVMDPDLLDFMKEQYEFYQYMKKDVGSHNKKLQGHPEFYSTIKS